MIAKLYRLSRRTIEHILKKGEQRATKLFILRFLKNNEKFSRYCVIISKKCTSKATDRTRLRRQIYEAIRINSRKNAEAPQNPRDIALIPKKTILKTDFPEIEADIKKILA